MLLSKLYIKVELFIKIVLIYSTLNTFKNEFHQYSAKIGNYAFLINLKMYYLFINCFINDKLSLIT